MAMINEPDFLPLYVVRQLAQQQLWCAPIAAQPATAGWRENYLASVCLAAALVWWI